MSLPTLADLKVHANITSTADDDELVDMLDAALDVVVGIIGPVGATPLTEVHYGHCSPLLVLRQAPVMSVSTISYSYFGGASTTVDPAGYVLDSATGIVRMLTGAAFVGDVSVTYAAGRDEVPAAIRLAVLIIARHLYETQTRPGFTSDAPAGFGGVDGLPDATIPGGLGYAIPSRAQELLQPYMLGPAIA